MAEKASTTHLTRFKWNSEIVEDLIDALQNYKAVCEYQGLDFNANKVKQYEEIRKNLARKYKEESFFGIEFFSEKPHEGFSTDEKKVEFCKKLQREREGIEKGYNRVLAKIKDIRQRFSTAFTTGSRSGSEKIILEYYDKLVLIWGGSAAVEPLNYGIDSSCVNEYSTNGENIANESNTSTSSSSSSSNDIVGGSSTGSGINSTGRFNQETTEATSLHNNNDLSDSETDPVVKKIKRNPIPKLIYDKRKHLQKKLCASDRDQILLNESREDSQFKRDLAEAIRQSNELFAQSAKELSQSMLAMASVITKSVEILSQTLSNQNQQASPP